MTRLRLFKVLLISVVVTTLIAVGTALWVLTSESALRLIAGRAATATGGSLSMSAPAGRLIGPIDIEDLSWENVDWSIKVKKIRLAWSPGALLDREIRIEQLGLESLTVRKKTVSEPGPPPATLRLPIGLTVQKLELALLQYDDLPAIRDLTMSLESDGQQHRLNLTGAHLADVALIGKANIDGSGPVRLEANSTLAGKVQDRPLRLDIDAKGPIERLSVRVLAHQGIEGEANLVATLFAGVPVSSAQIRLRGIDPSAWHQSAPQATIELQADITPDPKGISSRFTLINATAGQIDRDRLPLQRASGEMRWENDRAQFGSLSLDLSGQGKLNGTGQWKDQAFWFDLTAAQLDPESLHSKLRPASLNGPVKGNIGKNSQTVEMALQDPRFSIFGELTHHRGEISVPRLKLASGDAVLAVSGKLKLDDRSSYSVQGELRGFDPSRFAKVSPANINANLKADGRLEPHPVVDATFVLTDSNAFGQPLSGNGSIDLDGSILQAAKFHFAIGPNRIDANGAFGAPGKTFNIDIAAPSLEFPGVAGDLSGNIKLSGSRTRPVIQAKLTSSRLEISGKGNLRGGSLDMNLGSAPDDRLQIGLNAETLGLPTRIEPFRAIRLNVDGSNRDHRLDGSFSIAGNRNLSFAGNGGLVEEGGATGWRGKLSGARLTNEENRTLVQLDAPAPLELFPGKWKAGPLKLSDEPRIWLAELNAEANNKELKGSVEAQGKRIGTITGRLVAGMETAWSISENRPWDGRLQATIPDLSWIGEIFGDAWKSEGRLTGEVTIAGSPKQPAINGKIRGDALALRMREQGLNLVRGELDAVIKDNRLTLRKLSLESEPKPVPQPLRLAYPDATTLIKTPGRISVSGDLGLEQDRARENGSIEFQLDRVGLYQQPDQWILVSGNGKLNWSDGALSIQGKAAADAGYWRLTASGAPRLSDDVVIRKPGKKIETDNDRTRVDIDFGTDLGKRFLFAGGGLDTRLEGDVRWRKSGQDVMRATGSIYAVGGKFEAYGQQLEIERGILSFQGLPDNPAVDVRAWRKGLPVEAGVDVTGTAKKPIVKLISQPELSESEKFTWLVLGHGPEQMSASDAAILVSAAGSAMGVGTGGGNQLKKSLGIDEFALRQGSVGENMSRMPTSRVAGNSTSGPASSDSQTVSVGKRISANTVIAYEQTLGTAETILKLTHNLTRRLAVIGRVGTDNAIDIFYSLTTDSQ